ncbi:MAG TPA: M55 family metallopeptidase [Candidatus Elarobacter sp.]|jgi:D-amino peptidase|nr:M55 family metallopeptidase [Candidatus Elarobacter sp.]
MNPNTSGLRLYVSADMEGTAAVCSWTQVDRTNTTEYPYYRRLMSQEVRAAIDGAREAGVGDVLVNDSHASMRNVLWDELPDDVRMIYGNRKPFSMAETAGGSFDAAFFTGYHGAIGTQDAVLDHTYTGDTLRETRVNGRPCSEAMLNAAVLGLSGVPVVLITGDRATVEQNKAVMPWLTGVAVKESIGRYAANSVSPARARELIRAGAKEAIERLAEAKPFTFEPPIALELDFNWTHNADYVEMMPGFERTGSRSVRFIHDDYRVVFKAYIAAFRLGAAANERV